MSNSTSGQTAGYEWGILMVRSGTLGNDDVSAVTMTTATNKTMTTTTNNKQRTKLANTAMHDKLLPQREKLANYKL